MKKIFFISLLVLFFNHSFARHIAGGELMYEYLGVGVNPNTSKYKITLRLFRDCESSGPRLENENVIVGIYSNGNLAYSLSLPMQGGLETLVLNTATFPCLVGNVSVCYEFATYAAQIDLPNTPQGYTLARYGCCRIGNITNTNGSNSIGNTYVTQIPGTTTLPNGHNSSPTFNIKDTALVCADKIFNLDFGATDVDGDILTYSFCNAYSAPNGSNNSPPPSTLSLIDIPYSSPFSGSDPLGGVQINNTTGIISGTAPFSGQYVVSVCITEWRNNVAISEHRKDFILKVQNCDFIEANLPDKIVQCDSFSVYFENQSASSAIQSYLWNFGENSSSQNSATSPTATHIYADTGKYKATLQVTGPNGCIGKDSTDVLVYPGFFPDFVYNGSCYQTPFYFRDTTKTNYGFVNKWFWDFGETTITTDTSSQKNSNFLYSYPGDRIVKLIVGSSKGCEKTIEKTIPVSDKPNLQLPFHDTLICSIDTLPLIALGTGSFTWSPTINLLNSNTATPLSFPKDSITYYVTLVENNCIAKDSIKVNVLDFIDVDAGLDSSICRTDSFQLHPTSYALGYLWAASTGEVVAPIKYPTVKPLIDTWYKVFANLGKCQANDSVFIKSIPYPQSVVNLDSSICFGTKAFLYGTIVGSSFQWYPSNAMQNANTLSPVVSPSKDTWYYLTSRDTLGCPKPFTDSVLITVIKPVVVHAGNDTSIAKNQPLQLNANSNYDNTANYKWIPTTWLNNANIAAPIALITSPINEIKYKVKVTLPEGCVGEDEIIVSIFNSEPDIFVPTAFSPNRDGKNDLLKPICVGIKQLKFFRVYNRWGQLIFETNEFEKGWDGTMSGTAQPSGTYVFVAEGIDYLGKTVSKKGTVVLIR